MAGEDTGRCIRDVYKRQLVPLYIEVEDGERLQRALDRERQQTEPKYAAVSYTHLDVYKRQELDCETDGSSRYESRT